MVSDSGFRFSWFQVPLIHAINWSFSMFLHYLLLSSKKKSRFSNKKSSHSHTVNLQQWKRFKFSYLKVYMWFFFQSSPDSAESECMNLFGLHTFNRINFNLQDENRTNSNNKTETQILNRWGQPTLCLTHRAFKIMILEQLE